MFKQLFNDLYSYRQLLKSNVSKEIRGKYKGSFLGVLWSFVNPLLMTLVYAIVFPFVLKTGQPHYVTFLIIGVLPWNFFTTVINQGTNCILVNGGIIKKVYFPREILPISIATSGLVNFLISSIIILIFLFFSGVGYSFNILFYPLIVLIQYILSMGILFITCSIDVYIRDAEYIINFFIMMLFYGTPVLYSASLFPKKIRTILNFNPMCPIINSYRDKKKKKKVPDLSLLLIVLVESIVLFVIGLKVFNKLQKGFAEEV